MKEILIGIVVLISITAHSQRPRGGILVLDETYYVPSQTGFRIVTSNDSISHIFIREFANTGKAHKLTHTVKQDRYGSYWERSFYFKYEYHNEVVTFIKTLNKQKK